MATDKPRFSITVSDDVYQQINDYQHEHRLPTQTKAVLAFIEKGLEVIQKEKKPPTGIIDVEPLQVYQTKGDLSPSEQAHIKKYRSLDPYGKEAVDSVLDVEWRRCTELTQPQPKTIIQVAARDGSRMEVEVDGEITIPEEDADIPE